MVPKEKYAKSFYTEVEDRDSAKHEATSGVPQGSAFGSLLFLSVRNELTPAQKRPIYLFAESVKAIGSTTRGNISSDKAVVPD